MCNVFVVISCCYNWYLLEISKFNIANKIWVAIFRTPPPQKKKKKKKKNLQVFTLLPALDSIIMSLTDWNATDYNGTVPFPPEMRSFILPLALNYLTPLPVAILGIGAISAAVMSSADSCILSTSSVITKNIYQDIIRPKVRWLSLNVLKRKIF